MNWWRRRGNYALTVICCCIPELEPERAVKFFDVCAYFGANARLLPFKEVRGGPLVGLEYLDLHPYDVIFTHNHIGEYGHPHHTQVCEHVWVDAKCPIYQFGYGLDDDMHELHFTWADKLEGIRLYNHISHMAGIPKHQELLDVWGAVFDLDHEYYVEVER